MRFAHRIFGLGLVIAALATPGLAATRFTGDRIDGVPVIDKLDVADLPSGQVGRFYFRVIDQAAGQGWYVPVLVAKGARPGKRLLLTAAIHGDELNGIDIIHRLFGELDPSQMSGTVTAIPGINAPGILNATRGFTPSEGAEALNLNRLMPGDVQGSEAGQIYAGRIWSQLFASNADLAIDLHTQSRGTRYPMYVFAETRAARHIADLLRPDVIKMDAGVKGTVENMLNAAGVGAVTLELGGPEQFDPTMVRRALAGLRNVMIDAGMISGRTELTGPAPFVGNRSVDVSLARGGYAHILVALGDKVTAGQAVATLSDPFGRVVATANAPISGQVTSLATTPIRDPGSLLVRILTWSDTEVCKADGCH